MKNTLPEVLGDLLSYIGNEPLSDKFNIIPISTRRDKLYVL